MTRRGYWIRFVVSLAIDLLDMTFGRIPLFGSLGEGVGSLVLMALWGPAGLLYLGELADVTDQVDGFIPTATLIALIVGWRQGHILRRRAEAPSGQIITQSSPVHGGGGERSEPEGG